jgi:hypothetical protein
MTKKEKKSKIKTYAERYTELSKKSNDPLSKRQYSKAAEYWKDK